MLIYHDTLIYIKSAQFKRLTAVYYANANRYKMRRNLTPFIGFDTVYMAISQNFHNFFLVKYFHTILLTPRSTTRRGT